MYRRAAGVLQVLLVHPGGPFWVRRDAGAWSIPKGEYGPDEDPEDAARREFSEELGMAAQGACQPLGEIRQKGGKIVTAFALEGDLDVDTITSSHFEIEWPPHSGQRKSFPEVDRAQWFDLDEARERILPAQVPLLNRLFALLGAKL